MNVLFLINFAGQGGTETYVHILSQRLIDAGHKVHLAYNIDGMLCIRLSELGVKPYQVEMKHPFDIGAARKVAKYCKQNKIHIIHTQHQRENYIAILAKTFCPGVKAVFTCHFAAPNSGMWQTMNSFMMPRDDGVIAVCEAVKGFLVQNKTPEKKITIIHNGVPPVFLSPSEKATARQQVRRDYKIRDFEMVYVTMARFTPEKGSRFLLDSIKALTDKTPLPFKVFMVGDGDLLKECTEYAETLGITDKVIFTGYLQDTGDVLAASDVYINSSKSEALSFGILEAMAKELPIIATKVGGNPDIVNDKTGCGVLVPYGNTEAMAAEMWRFMNQDDRRRELGQNALYAVKEHFNLENTIAQTFGLYESLTEGKKGDTKDEANR